MALLQNGNFRRAFSCCCFCPFSSRSHARQGLYLHGYRLTYPFSCYDSRILLYLFGQVSSDESHDEVVWMRFLQQELCRDCSYERFVLFAHLGHPDHPDTDRKKLLLFSNTRSRKTKRNLSNTRGYWMAINWKSQAFRTVNKHGNFKSM